MWVNEEKGIIEDIDSQFRIIPIEMISNSSHIQRAHGFTGMGRIHRDRSQNVEIKMSTVYTGIS